MPTDPDLQFRHFHQQYTAELADLLSGFPDSMTITPSVYYSVPNAPGYEPKYCVTIRCVIERRSGREHWGQQWVIGAWELKSIKMGRDWYWKHLIGQFWRNLGEEFLKKESA